MTGQASLIELTVGQRVQVPSIVLITGANGFIGSHVTLLFESLGHRVVPVDIVPRSHDLSLLPIKVSTTRLDVTDSKGFRKLCKAKKVTHVVHAAHPRQDESPELLSSCLQAMRVILETAKELGVQRVVFASSGAVYGRANRRDRRFVREDHPVDVHPIFLHRAGKILGEWLGHFYAQRYGVGFIALRLSSVYGPGQPEGIGASIKEGILGRECRPYLPRLPDDLIFVKDATQALCVACFSERAASRVYNIASGKAYAEGDLENAMRRHLPGVSFEIAEPPVSKTIDQFPQGRLLDVTLAREELGFIPQFDLESGIAATAKWVRSEKRRLS